MKKIFVLIFMLFLVVGCNSSKVNSDNYEKFYLDDKYYDESFLKKISSQELIELENNKDSFAVLVHIPGACNSDVPFAPLVEDFINTYNITLYEINFKDINNTQIDDYVKYSPSLVIYDKGKLIAYMDANSNDDLQYYKSVDGIKNWFSKYVYLK